MGDRKLSVSDLSWGGKGKNGQEVPIMLMMSSQITCLCGIYIWGLLIPLL